MVNPMISSTLCCVHGVRELPGYSKLGELASVAHHKPMQKKFAICDKNSIERLFCVVTLHRQEEPGRRGDHSPLTTENIDILVQTRRAVRPTNGPQRTVQAGGNTSGRRDTGISPTGSAHPLC